MLTFLEEFPDILTSVLKENSQPIILGDFNTPWNSQNHIDTRSLAEMLNTFNLLQLINFPTQSRQHSRLDYTQGGTKLYP